MLVELVELTVVGRIHGADLWHERRELLHGEPLRPDPGRGGAGQGPVPGSYTVITQAGIDTATSLYYMGDQLVAIDHTLLPGRRSCTAGPSTFSPPSCDPGGTQLPACAQ